MEERLRWIKHPVVVYVTGRPATGKTSLADGIGEHGIGSLRKKDIHVFHLDFKRAPEAKMEAAIALASRLN